MRRKLVFSVLISCFMLTRIDSCLADESGMLVCPDLHQHVNVLNDGQRYYNQNKNLSRSSPGRNLKPAEVDAYIDNRFPVVYDTSLDEKQIVKEIANLRFDSETGLAGATKLANECLLLGRFPEAYDITKRVLCAYDSGSIHAHPDNIAEAMRTMIRCKLISGCENIDQVERLSGARMLYRKYSGYDSNHLQDLGYDQIIYFNLSHQIKPDHPENLAWDEALSLYNRLDKLHVDKPNDSSFLCLIATLLEWNHQIAESHDMLLSVEEINPSEFVQNTITSFCQRNDDFEVLKHLESKLVGSRQTELVAILRLYLDKNHCGEASQIFRKLVSNYHASSQLTQGVVLYAIHDSIKCLEVSDEPTLKTFLVTELEQNYSFDIEWIAIILTEGEKKWKNFAVETFRDYTQRNRKQTPGPLRQFALYFASNNNYELSLEAQSAVLASIERTTKIWENVDQRFDSLAAAKTDLSAPWVTHSERGKALRKQVELALSQISAEHEKRECLAVAAELDETASKLESRDLFAKAEEMHRESLDIKSKNLGPNNAEILLSLNGLARTLSMQKKYKEADAAYQKAIALYHGNKQFQDRSYATVLESYAQMLASAGQKTKSDKIYEDARTFYRTIKN